jgi:hypothetical protein
VSRRSLARRAWGIAQASLALTMVMSAEVVFGRRFKHSARRVAGVCAAVSATFAMVRCDREKLQSNMKWTAGPATGSKASQKLAIKASCYGKTLCWSLAQPD